MNERRPLNPGDFNHRITLQEPTVSTDTTSFERTTAFTDKRNVWAQFLSNNGQWAAYAQVRYGEYTYRMRIRYWSEVNMDWRVKIGTDTYDIVGIENMEMRNETLILTVLKREN